MGFDRGEIRVKATNISVVDRKRRESILGCRVVSDACWASSRPRLVKLLLRGLTIIERS